MEICDLTTISVLKSKKSINDVKGFHRGIRKAIFDNFLSAADKRDAARARSTYLSCINSLLSRLKSRFPFPHKLHAIFFINLHSIWCLSGVALTVIAKKEPRT